MKLKVAGGLCFTRHHDEGSAGRRFSLLSISLRLFSKEIREKNGDLSDSWRTEVVAGIHSTISKKARCLPNGPDRKLAQT